jgi:protein gp37
VAEQHNQGDAADRLFSAANKRVGRNQWPLPNVWLGHSIANKTDADRDIAIFLESPAAVHFLSVEPLLGPVDLRPWLHGHEDAGTPPLDWVIVGGESGPGARPCNVQWIRSIVGQCKDAGCCVFCEAARAQPLIDVRDDRTISGWRKRPLRDRKGGDWSEWPEDLRIREFPEVPANG